MSALGYFPGCSLEGSANEYDLSSRIVCRHLGIELQELLDWSCCGAHAAHHTKHMLSTALSVRNLSIAANQGLDKVTAPCPACYNRLKSAQKELSDPRLQEEFKTAIEVNYNPQMEISSMVELLAGIEPAKIKAKVKKDLGKLKLVAYYGCLVVRPPELTRFDDPEDPCSMDDLLKNIGIQVMQWDYKVQCCGAAMAISDPEVQTKLSGDILEMAYLAGAEAIAVACPLCQVNLDLKQNQINRIRESKFNLPIFYFTQLMGLAFGASPKELGIDKLIVDAMPLLAKTGIKA